MKSVRDGAARIGLGVVELPAHSLLEHFERVGAFCDRVGGNYARLVKHLQGFQENVYVRPGLPAAKRLPRYDLFLLRFHKRYNSSIETLVFSDRDRSDRLVEKYSDLARNNQLPESKPRLKIPVCLLVLSDDRSTFGLMGVGEKPAEEEWAIVSART